MALTYISVKQVKATRPAGGKHVDDGGMYQLVTESGKYYRAAPRAIVAPGIETP